MRQMSRRRFLWCVGGAGSLGGWSTAMLLRSGRARGKQPTEQAVNSVGELRPVTRNSWALGSMVALTVLHHNESEARRAIDAAFDELEVIEDTLSLYRPDSQVSQLNHHRELRNPHPHLLRLLQVARRMSERTDGAFDITVQPLWELYAHAQKAGQLPSEQDVERARRQVDWKRVKIGRSVVRLDGDGTKITLNGLAQGFAADRVVGILRNHGIEHALIDTGEISTLGARSPHDDWTIGIQHPRTDDAYLSLAKLAGRCLATSGDYATTFTPDRRHHHLFHPRTGHSPTVFSSVSIAADTALTADVLSTAVFVMGLDQGLSLVRESAGSEALMVLKSGETIATSGFPTA